MNYIDSHLFELGYTIQDEKLYEATYAKKLYEFVEDKGRVQSDYCQVVEIRRIFDEKLVGTASISSYLMGNSCSWGGQHCALPLNLCEFKWFYRKMCVLDIKWRLMCRFSFLRKWWRKAYE